MGKRFSSQCTFILLYLIFISFFDVAVATAVVVQSHTRPHLGLPEVIVKNDTLICLFSPGDEFDVNHNEHLIYSNYILQIYFYKLRHNHGTLKNTKSGATVIEFKLNVSSSTYIDNISQIRICQLCIKPTDFLVV